MRLSLLTAVLAIAACDPGAEAECGAPADCGAVESAPCERCASPSAGFCVDGECAERAANAVDVTATFLIDRDLEGVRGLAWAIALADRPCSALTEFPADLNVVAAGQKTLTGGDLHPDLQLAPAPEGALLVLALATSGDAGEGDVLGSGCVEATATAPNLAIPQIDLE